MPPATTTSTTTTASKSVPADPIKLPKKGQQPARISPMHLQPPSHKKIYRNSSKPIINWLQRKLAGSVRVKRVNTEPPLLHSIPLKPTNRAASSPLPSPTVYRGRQLRKQQQEHGRPDEAVTLHRNTVSLNGDDSVRNYSHSDYVGDDDESGGDASSMALESTWSPTSPLEADEDASLRPLPPSVPPSPSPSHSSSSYLSDPRTFRSIAASTKPTTLMSIDLNGNGMAHIAQAPLTPISQRAHHARNNSAATNPNILSSAASITFSALPPSPQSSRAPSLQTGYPQAGTVQAPLHTTHHPRNNPRPSSIPPDNASMLTLASSAFAMPGMRGGANTPGWQSSPPSALAETDWVSQFDGSEISGDGDGEDTMEERDFDASVRALRPRSSRRGSWESEASRWSARIQGTSLTRERSVWTTNSAKTGAFTNDNVDEITDEGQDTMENCKKPDPIEVVPVSPSVVSDSEATPKNILQTLEPVANVADVASIVVAEPKSEAFPELEPEAKSEATPIDTSNSSMSTVALD